MKFTSNSSKIVRLPRNVAKGMFFKWVWDAHLWCVFGGFGTGTLYWTSPHAGLAGVSGHACKVIEDAARTRGQGSENVLLTQAKHSSKMQIKINEGEDCMQRCMKHRSAGTHTNTRTLTHTVHDLILTIRKHQYQTKENTKSAMEALRGKRQTKKRGKGWQRTAGTLMCACVCVRVDKEHLAAGWCDTSQNAIAQFVSNTESERGRNRQRTKSEKEGGQELREI